jgi:hypothetical protein
MKTRRFCPHCGRPLLKSQVKGYAFRCFCCDADFYRFEVLRKRDLENVKLIRKNRIQWERKNDYALYSIYKPYPQPKRVQ